LLRSWRDACIVERGSWPAGRAASRGGDVSLRSWRRPGGPPYVQWTSRCAREGGAFIVERDSWPAGFATSRGGDVSLRSWRRPLSWSGAPGPLASQLYAEWMSRFARGGGPEDRPTLPHVQCPMYSALRTVTPRFAREGGPDRIGQADPFAEPRQRTVRYER